MKITLIKGKGGRPTIANWDGPEPVSIISVEKELCRRSYNVKNRDRYIDKSQAVEN